MEMRKTRRFEHGRFNYSIEYVQYQMEAIDTETGEKSMVLCHHEIVKYYEFPFTFGKEIQFGRCEDTGAYYRQ
jgi:hypothetical protein